MKRYVISAKVEPYIHHMLYVVIYHYIINRDFQRHCDGLRGALSLCYHIRLCSTDFYIFLTNFFVWLENKSGFSEDDNETFQYFYDGFVEDLQSNTDFLN